MCLFSFGFIIPYNVTCQAWVIQVNCVPKSLVDSSVTDEKVQPPSKGGQYSSNSPTRYWRGNSQISVTIHRRFSIKRMFPMVVVGFLLPGIRENSSALKIFLSKRSGCYCLVKHELNRIKTTLELCCHYSIQHLILYCHKAQTRITHTCI